MVAVAAMGASPGGGVARFTLEPVLRGPDFGGAGAPLRIAAVDAWGARLVLATADARLLVFAQGDGDGGGGDAGDSTAHGSVRSTYVLVESHADFRGTRALLQLAVVDSSGLLVTLTESGGVQAHALLPELCEAAPPLARTRGGSCFAWSDGYGRSKAAGDAREPARLAVGVKKRVLVYSPKFGTDLSQLAEVGDVGAPDSVRAMAWGGGDSLVVGTKREYCVVDARTGQVTELFAVGTVSPPLAIGMPASAVQASADGIASLNNADEALVQRDATSVFVGAGGTTSRAHGLTWSAPPAALAIAQPYAVAVTRAGVEVRSITRNMLVQAVPVPGLSMLSRGAGGGATVFAAGDSQVWRLSARPLLEQARALLEAGENEEAIAVCAQVSSTSPLANECTTIERRACTAHARVLFAQAQYEEALSYFSRAAADPLEVLELYPSLGVKAALDGAAAFGDVGGGTHHRQPMALAALLPFLMEARERMRVLDEHKAHNLTGGDDSEDFDPETVEVDTAIVQAMVGTGLPDVAIVPFLREHNAADLKATEGCLRAASRHDALLELNKSRGRHRRSLEYLQQLAVGAGGAVASGARGADDLMVDYLLGLRRAAAHDAARTGRRDCVAEAEQLLLEFSVHLLRRPSASAAVLRLLRELEPPLPAVVALRHVRTHAPSLVASFLEDELSQRGEAAPPELHDELALAYLVRTRSERAALPAGSEELTASQTKLRGMIRDAPCKLHPERLLSALPAVSTGDLLEERADCMALLSPPRYEQALRLLCRVRRRPDLAHRYCARVTSLRGEDETEEVYQALLEVLLDPKVGRQHGEEDVGGTGEVLLDEALLVLERYAHALDPSAAVRVLPDAAKLAEALPFLRAAVVSSGERRREAAAARSLARAEALASQAERINMLERRVTVAPDAACAVCFKRLGTAAFVDLGGGVLAHFRCVKDTLRPRDAPQLSLG